MADLMTYGELRDYIAQLRASGANVVPYLVALQRKSRVPVRDGRHDAARGAVRGHDRPRGALYGIGIGIVLAIVYWIVAERLRGARRGGLS